ncbi:zinc finger, CCHC-type containing protein [Tanacetum coccineum]
MTDSIPVLEQYNECLGIIGKFTQHKINMDESIQVSCIIDKLPPSWKDFKHTLKHLKEELTLVELGSHLRIKESLRVQDSDKPKSNNVAGPQTESKVLGAVARLPDPKLKTLGERGIECIFVGYADHSKAFRFSSVPKPSLRIPNGTEDISGLVILDEVTKEKEAINDEIDSIIGNNTWVLADLPPGCEPLGCKWIFKRKLKVDGTIEKFKARLVIQDFKQKSRIDFFDAYAPVPHISTIRLLITIASIHNLIIHQMDVKTAFLNGDLDEEVYMNQPRASSCLAMKTRINQADKCVYSKFDESGKGVIICLYVDDMLIFGTDQVQVNLTKKFLSSNFSIKDMGEADVILGIRIKHESNGIAISLSHYIEKILKKFNYFDCSLVSTPMDTSEKLMPNNSQAVSQLEYSKVIGCLMYAMTCTRPNIAIVVGKLSMYTILKYLKKTMDYRLTYAIYPSLLEGYTDSSWIINTVDNTRGWVFLLGGGAISWASKKQTCITAHISICCDSAATLAKAYSQMYNEKSRHLSVRHNMIRELITNGVISIEFVSFHQNLVDYLTKGLARDLVIKSAEGMGLNGLKNMYLHIIPRMCLEPAEKKDEVVNFLMVNFFEKVLSRSMNKEESPMYSNGLKGSILKTP